jgi:ABC-2 type transport system ATP-binding protein
VPELLATLSAGRVTLRTSAPVAATEALARAGAAVHAEGADTLGVSGLTGEAVVTVLTAGGVPFAELATHRATLEEAYLQLTRDAVQYRGAGVEDTAR